jgi:hypothetical protein
MFHIPRPTRTCRLIFSQLLTILYYRVLTMLTVSSVTATLLTYVLEQTRSAIQVIRASPTEIVRALVHHISVSDREGLRDLREIA